ncbi:alpha/beta-hydrolase [Zopfia rhizophila CBS 207.26]|uniref:Dipeptidyl-peptidase V n=1 Tax=Zopfia rhizophila CBS 207.26 TaxID=1314779 RepID=A0A6A6E9E0_9PEZI|nr:alpha/beta-hydrolase [Zopfia rhizophila CBS 207.26]
MTILRNILVGSLLLGFTLAFTPEQMLAAPRRSTGIVNPSGEWALFSSTSYDWEKHKASTSWHLLNVASGNITKAPFGSDVDEVVWVGPSNTSILYINGSNVEIPGGVTLYTADLGANNFSPTLVASLDAPFAGLKAVKTESGSINFIVNSLAYWNNGSAYNPELVSEPLSSGQLYDANFVRHWDFYIASERYSIFSGVLASTNSSYKFDGTLKNLLWEMDAAITRPETPVQPFGDQGDYDISPDGKTVAFLTKAPELPKANYTASYIYIVPHDGSEGAVPVNGPNSTAPESAQGASESPKWSPDGSKLAYCQQDGIAYESDRFKCYVAEINGLESKVSPIAEEWDSSPAFLQWGPDSQDLYIGSELHASVRAWIVPADAKADYKPENITGPESNIADFTVLSDGSVFVSAQSSWSSRIFYTLTPGEKPNVLFTANEVDKELKGLGPQDVSNFWYEGGDGDLIQCFVFYPTDFDPSKKYPLVFNVHGGPQSTQGDNWSTRWNLRMWADQGYIVTSPQFTGSPSYSQRFTDAIQDNWGGTPYQDLVKLFEYLDANVRYIDTDNAVAVGASFGGYMMSWIQGHELGRKFKAIVSHDGKLSLTGSYGTEELWFIQHDQNGTIWNNRENYEKWDPLYHVKNFSTPHFVVHNDLDYRVTANEGIMLFNVLQSLGVPSRFLHFPDEGHWVLNRENSLVWHKAIFNWINYWTGKEDSLLQDIVIKQ